jgi:hypothetical protein
VLEGENDLFVGKQKALFKNVLSIFLLKQLEKILLSSCFGRKSLLSLKLYGEKKALSEEKKMPIKSFA